jgi:hypothetical protein
MYYTTFWLKEQPKRKKPYSRVEYRVSLLLLTVADAHTQQLNVA